MTALIVLGCILLALLLIGQIRVGAAVDYSEAGLFLKIKAGPVRLQILPAKERKKKKEKKPKPASKHPAEEGAEAESKRSVKDTLSLALRFVPLLGEAAGQLIRKIRIDCLNLHVIWGSADPASAALGFGAGNAALGILWPIFEHNFHVKKYDLRVDVDFERKTPALTAQAQATLTIGQFVSLGLRLGFKALKIYLGVRREQTEQEKAVQA
ncbi:MAG: DUF2953 domain-containing protein [Oscillospiraceae bacterium]